MKNMAKYIIILIILIASDLNAQNTIWRDYFNTADSCRRQKNNICAIDNFRKATEHMDSSYFQYTTVLTHLGLVLEKEALYSEALSEHQKALKYYERVGIVNPNKKYEILENIARVKYELKDYKGAIDAYDIVIDFYPKNNFSRFYKRGRAKEAIGDTAGAIVDYQNSLDIRPNFGSAEYSLNRLIYLVNIESHIDSINILISNRPDDNQLILKRAIMYEDKGDLEMALEDLSYLLKSDDNSYYYKRRSILRLKNGDCKGAKKDLKKVEKFGGTVTETLYSNVENCIKNNNP
jgi:tetratricopeptide (TPR) repeat protein